jgi:hypothetical protein
MPTVPKLKGVHTTEEFVELILSGLFPVDIAEKWGVTRSAIFQWVESDPERSARAREARAQTGQIWDQEGTKVLSSLPDDATPGQIARARELASHYRWRASKIGGDYRDKTHATVEAVVKKAKPATDEEMVAEIAELTQALGMKYQLVEIVDEEGEEE